MLYWKQMRLRFPLPVCVFFLAVTAIPVRAQSSFALYFNSDQVHITTVIIYNESSLPLSLDLNGEIDWEHTDRVTGSGTATVLVPGDLISLRQDFMTGDCITIESESDELSLAMTNDRDSVYIYASEGLDKGTVITDN